MLYIYILIDLFAYIHNYATMKKQNFEAIRRYNSNTINTKLAIKDVEKIW